MLGDWRNKLLLSVTALAILLLLGLAVVLVVRLMNRNQALKASMEVLQAHQENTQQQYELQLKYLEAKIHEQEALNESLRRRMAEIGKEKTLLITQNHEAELTIHRIRAVDSLWHEIAGHYR